ncbi:DUF2066 domain-containing protein [Stutzerimonas zhaodongensis]|uniref:DUF2066 domain-containing protein n=1 Tax=Stutzerimonas zhaodongensis TaxID=1176257 RepID=A0A3M2HQS1_9GAMM|nr:DUF2066 domain-containing protein [Stutzerimonas zhaodongensis]MCQ4317480.1 DUF2066 domain-containing protein [Stutzerimonas zhaodongensis]RMH89950.1 DUF2066 domain-containing protein [Stutzerimonas zhaodongensis]
MRFIPRLIALCCAVVSAHGIAAPLSDLYKVREPVASQQPEEREEAMRKALDTLVLRLTGEPLSSDKAVAQLREDPQQLVSRYAYEGNAVIVSFDPTTTERALRTAGLSLWGADRPSILTWWLTESAEGSQLVGDAQESAAALQAAAQHRGLPMRLPLADLSEQLAATADAVSSKDPQGLREISDRYDADGLLAVLAKQSDENWEASWRLWLGDKQSQGKASGESRAAVADKVMLAVSTFLAPQYRVAPGATSEITLEVLGADVSRFAELDRLLEPFAAQLQRVESDRLVYRLRASQEQLRAQLALARLQEVPADEIDTQSIGADESEAAAQADNEVVATDESDSQSVGGQTDSGQSTGAQMRQSQPAEQGEVLRYRW